METRQQRHQRTDAQRLALKVAYITLTTAIVSLMVAIISLITALVK